MKNHPHNSLSDFVATVTRQKLDATSIFRGQRDAEWALENRWKRFRDDFHIGSHKGSEVRDKLRENAFAHLQAQKIGRKEMTDCEIEALCQHNGLPTRLMDWSYSPYVALFFALDAASLAPNHASECAVFELNLKSFEFACCYGIDNDEKKARTEKAKSYAYTNSVTGMSPGILQVNDRDNQRVNRQKGLFLILPDNYASLEGFEAGCIDKHSDSEFLTKHTIPNADRIAYIKHVQAMACTAAHLFCAPEMSAIDAAFQTLAEL